MNVWITGIGVVSPIGNTREDFWASCLAGRSGAARVDSEWVTGTDLSTKIAATIRDFDPAAAGIEPRQQRVLDRTTQFALAAAGEALDDAGFARSPLDRGERFQVEGVDPLRMGSVIGSGIGGITSLEISHATWREERTKVPVKRFSLPMLIPNAPAGQVAIRFGARGECKAICTACAAGTMAIGDGYRMLRDDEADVVIAGGADGVAGDADGYGLMGFERLKTLSTRNDEPHRASRPFDRERDGFVLGEGAAVLILEREEHARARGTKPYAAISGYSVNCDAFSMMQLDESGESIRRLLLAALESARLSAGDVDYVSAHGTSTELNDKTEALALRKAFGDQCDRLPVTALKSMTGHGIGASGPMETAAAVLSMRHGKLAPTINYEFPDPECNVDVVANEPRERKVRACLKMSYGFGGHNACLVLTEV